MILDSSALVSMLLKEDGHEELEEKAGLANCLFVSAPTALETAMVVSARSRQDARPMIAALLRQLNAEVVEFNEYHYEAAVTAFLRFGKGRHPAALNFADCICYAVSALSGLPLLFSGEDFAKTDIQCA